MAKPDKSDDTTKFPRERLISRGATLTGYPSHVVAGALSLVRGDGPMTVARADEAIEKFLNRAVRED